MYIYLKTFVAAILICCCIKIRIPRTKQEIEADYRRKKLAQKFRQRLRLIQNQEMDALDLHRGIEEYPVVKKKIMKIVFSIGNNTRRL